MTETADASIPVREVEGHLTSQQRGVLRELLAARLRTHRERTAHAASSIEVLSSGDSPYDREAARDIHESLRAAVTLHEQALERVDAGVYGICGGCARPIPYERLEAIPEVHHCVSCTHLA